MDLNKHLENGNEKLTEILINNGVVQSANDYTLFVKNKDNVFIVLLVYVDDIVVTGNDKVEIEKFKKYLNSKFMIKDLGILKYFLGIEVFQSDSGICLSQRKYALDLLVELGLTSCKHVSTPIETNVVISDQTNSKENDSLLFDLTSYQRLIGKLIYLTLTRPDISYDVHCLSQFMHASLKSHLKLAFRVLRYIYKRFTRKRNSFF